EQLPTPVNPAARGKRGDIECLQSSSNGEFCYKVSQRGNSPPVVAPMKVIPPKTQQHLRLGAALPVPVEKLLHERFPANRGLEPGIGAETSDLNLQSPYDITAQRNAP